MPTAIELHFVNIIAYVNIPFTLRYSRISRRGVLIPEAPQWNLVAGSNAADVQDIGYGLIRVLPLEVGKIGFFGVGADGKEAPYWVKVEPFVIIAGFGVHEYVGSIIECIQFGDEPELPVLPPPPPPPEE